jgi:hypothetical protein
MASTINADNGVVSGITGIRTTADNTGNLSLQANGVTLLTVATNNTIVLGNTLKFADGTTANTAASGGGGGLSWGGIQTANFTANISTIYVVSTVAGPKTVTLPASPGAGNTVQFTDYARTWGSNAVTLLPNGSNIVNSTANISLNTNGSSVALIYTDASQGWITYDGFTNPPAGAPYTINYLVVAGGGGGAPGYGGGGGAGGLLNATYLVLIGTAYTITVGAGGSGGVSTSPAPSGVNSSISSIANAIGGGGGSLGVNGASGGSGGGAGYYLGNSGGAGTSGQGSSGGNSSTATPNYGAGGGGGAGAVGGNGTGTTGGNGGIGTSISIGGNANYYAGGGGGGIYTGGTAGSGGTGGGGAGSAAGNGSAGTANTGGGGGGGFYGATQFSGGNGGSGIVVIWYTGSQKGTGGTVTSSGGNTIHTFTSSGTYTA